MKRQFLRLILSLTGVLPGAFAYSQCPVYTVTVPSTLCINESFDIVNTTPGSSYAWDFCGGDLKTIPDVNSLGLIQGATYIVDIRVLQQSGSWFGFAVDLNSRNLIRFDFGNNPRNLVAATTNLGNPGNLISSPSGLDFIFDGTNWFGTMMNGIDQNLILFEFGNSLTNTPTAKVIYSGIGGQYANLVVKQSGSSFFVILSEFNANQVRVINYSSGLSNPATGENSFSVGFNPIDVQVVEQCGSWFAFVLDFNNKVVVRLDYGSDLMQTPTKTTLAGSTLPFFPYRMQTVFEGGEFFCFITNIDGGLARLDMGNSVSNNTSSLTLFPGFTSLINSWSFDVVSLNGIWTAFMPNGSNGLFNQLAFQSNCANNIGTSNLKSPAGVFYTSSGPKKITVTTTTSSGSTSFKAFSLTVNSNVAPSISINAVGQCINQPVAFSIQSNPAGSIVNQQWNFGDAVTDNQPAPTHAYSSAGNFNSTLKGFDVNGCSATGTLVIPIFAVPVSQFTLPSASPVCSNQNYLYTNTSTVNPLSQLTWEWRLNGTLVSNAKDLNTPFTSSGTQEIRLKVLIPGCQNESIQMVSSVITGPVTDFTVADNCQGVAVPFTNTSSGADAGYLWDFGDSGSSTQTSTSHSYSPGTFQAKLTASNSAGCHNFVTKPVRIYSKPIPDFSVGSPPFSCSNSATPFQNNTPSPTDSNITTWAWQFGDGNNGTSSAQNPSYIYSSAGNFPVLLTATTDKGCTASTLKGTVIAPGPVADFTIGPSCLNLATKFTDLSSGSVQTRSWQIGPASFNTASPSYTFTSSGDYSATLTVTSANLCSTFKTTPINVPVPPTLDFSKSNLCAGKNTLFTDNTPPQRDAVVGWNWNFDGNSVAGNPAQYSFASPGTYTAKMTTTHTSGCKYTVSKNVLINATPVASFTATPDRGAPPLIVQFTNTSQGATTNSWKFYDKTTSVSTQVSPAYTFLALGDYSVELTASNTLGCSDVKTIPIKVLVPSVDLILSDFSLTPDPTTGKLKGVVTILNSSNIPVTSAEVALILANNGVVNETFAVNLSPGQSVAKTLSFTVSPNQFDFNFLCAEIISEKDIQKDNNRRCVNLEKSDYFFNPFPNPTSGKLEVDWITVAPGSAAITIYDSMGKKSYAFEALSKAGLNQVVFDLTFLPSGLYYLTIETPASKKTSRFFRE